MRIVVAGGSGFLGSALRSALRATDFDVAVLTRRTPRAGEVAWTPDRDGPWTGVVEAADVVVNLAGAPLARRWTRAVKHEIQASRVVATSALARVVAGAPRPPAFISASGVGFYGLRGEEPIDEQGSPGSDFLARVCQDWEQAALHASPVTRVILLRTGVVLARHGGALPQLARPFRFLVGGPVGSGRQYLSWIHVDDWVRLVQWAITTAGLDGPINATAPQPVTSAGLARALGAAMHRPSFVRTPALPLRLVFGEMADAMLLGGQRVLPARALSLGFRFSHASIDDALNAVFTRPSKRP